MRAEELSHTGDLLGNGLLSFLTRTGISGTTLSYDWRAWHGFCEYLVFKELLPRNPVKKIAKPRKDTLPTRSLSNEDFAKLLEVAANGKHAKHLLPYYASGTYAGLRPQSEWPHLTWDSIVLDVEAEYQCIKVIRQKVNNPERYVRVFPVLEKLRKHVAKNAKKKPAKKRAH